MDRQRTLGLVAHIDAGKTTLSERILYDSGAQSWVGEVDRGTATMDWMPQEQQRGISIGAAATRVQWHGCELHLVDTPGHVDFTAEVERSLCVLDGVVVILDGVRGVESQTRTVWRQADRWQLSRLVFVNKLDRQGASMRRCVAMVEECFGCRVVPVVLPLREENGRFAGLGDAVRGRAIWFDGEVPAGLQPRFRAELAAARERALEVAADLDPAILGDFVADRVVSADRLLATLRAGCIAGTVVPAVCGAALLDQGVDWLLDAICDYLPGPGERGRTGPFGTLPPADPEASLAALVFKVEHVPHEVRNYARVFAGTIHAGDVVTVARTGASLSVPALWSMHAAHHRDVASARPGEIVVLPGSLPLQTGDILHAPGQPRELPVPTFPAPVLGKVFEPAAAADENALIARLADLQADDPTLRVERDPESGLPLVLGMGELHLEIVAERLAELGICRFQPSRPRVARRATIARAASAQATVAAPGGPQHGQASVRLELAPSPDGLGSAAGQPPAVEIAETAATMAPEARRAAVRAALHAALEGGLVLGLPATGLTVRVVSCMTSGDPAAADALAQQAAVIAAEKALAAAGPVRLEPMVAVEVRCPPEAASAVLADLGARGATTRQVSSGSMGAVIHGRGRLAAFLGYATRLRSISKGQGEAQLQPDGYAPDDTDSAV